MPLPWNQPFELRGRWDASRPAPDLEETGSSGSAPGEGAGPQQEPRPDSPEARPLWPAYGTLTFAPADGFGLDILGPEDPFGVHPAGTTIYGVTTEGDFSSLLDTSARSSKGTLGGYGQHVFGGRVLVHGAHVDSLAELPFARAEMEIRGLREALWHPDRGASGMTGLGNDNFEFAVEVPGARLTFRLGWEGIHKLHERRTHRAADVVIELDEALPFDGLFERWGLPLLDFVALATREPTRVETFTAVLTREAPAKWWKPDEPPSEEEHRVEVIRQQDLLLSESRFGHRRTLFFLGELPDAGAAVARWLELHARLGPSARFVFTALNSRMYVEHRLDNLTSSAEGYHRALHNEPPLAGERFDQLVEDMLARCETKTEREHFKVRLRYANSQGQRARLQWLYRRVEHLLPPLAARRSADVAGLVETRNYFTHQDKKTPGVLDTERLSRALHRLEAVLHGNILLDLRLDEEWVAAALQRSYEGHPSMR
jgi:ApeA N-terminal domain 1